jgi:transcriptional regulator with XRE-family HTH domain
MRTIGTKIRQLRELKNLSQEELAPLIETTQSNLCKIESGKTDKIDFLLMYRVCEFFKVDASYFIEPSQNIIVKKNKYNNSGSAIGNNNIITINNEKKDKNKDGNEDKDIG